MLVVYTLVFADSHACWRAFICSVVGGRFVEVYLINCRWLAIRIVGKFCYCCCLYFCCWHVQILSGKLYTHKFICICTHTSKLSYKSPMNNARYKYISKTYIYIYILRTLIIDFLIGPCRLSSNGFEAVLR